MMIRSVFGRRQTARSRRLGPEVDNLENRTLLTAGNVTQSGALVMVTPGSTGPTTAIVSYQTVEGTTVLDVNVNGSDNYFSLAQVGFVYYMGSASSGAQIFQNNTSLHTVAYGGSGTNLFESNGSGQDQFNGGSGANTFDAGSGYDVLIGGSGTNVFNESDVGTGVIVQLGAHSTVNASPGGATRYQIIGSSH